MSSMRIKGQAKSCSVLQHSHNRQCASELLPSSVKVKPTSSSKYEVLRHPLRCRPRLHCGQGYDRRRKTSVVRCALTQADFSVHRRARTTVTSSTSPPTSTSRATSSSRSTLRESASTSPTTSRTISRASPPSTTPPATFSSQYSSQHLSVSTLTVDIFAVKGS